MNGIEYIKTLMMVKRNLLVELVDKAKELGIELKELKARCEAYEDIILNIDTYQELTEAFTHGERNKQER